jgi:hypothetical protein
MRAGRTLDGPEGSRVEWAEPPGTPWRQRNAAERGSAAPESMTERDGVAAVEVPRGGGYRNN